MLFWNSINTALRLDLNSNDITINCMPPFHTGGWNVLITPLLHVGGTIHLMSKFDPNQLLAELETTKTTLLMVVPTMLKMMEDVVTRMQGNTVGIKVSPDLFLGFS